jgi:hypothetical protein
MVKNKGLIVATGLLRKIVFGALLLNIWNDAAMAADTDTFTLNAYNFNSTIRSLDDRLGRTIVDRTPTFTTQVNVLDYADGSAASAGLFDVNNAFPSGLRVQFFLEATGNFRVQDAGTYTFRIHHGDGARISINDDVLIDAPRRTDLSITQASVFLDAGVHDFSGFFFEDRGIGALEVAIGRGDLNDVTDFSLLMASGHEPVQPAPRLARIAPLTTSAIPEPATWFMMIIGFACVGLAFRRRGSAQNYHS